MFVTKPFQRADFPSYSPGVGGIGDFMSQSPFSGQTFRGHPWNRPSKQA